MGTTSGFSSKIATAHSLKGNQITLNEDGPSTSYPSPHAEVDFPTCESPTHAAAPDDTFLVSPQEETPSHSNPPHDRRPLSRGPSKQLPHDQNEHIHSIQSPRTPPPHRSPDHSHHHRSHEHWNPESFPSRSRPRTNSMLSLSLAFTPRQESLDSQFRGSESPTSVRSTRSMFNTFPTRPHTLFSLSRFTSTTSTSPSTSSRTTSWESITKGKYDVIRKSPLVTAEVLSASGVHEKWAPLHSRTRSSPMPTNTSSAKRQERAPEPERSTDVPFPTRTQDVASIGTGRSARDVLSAVHARERASSSSTAPGLPDFMLENKSSSSGGLLSRMRTRATSLRPQALLYWSSAGPAEPSSPEALPQGVNGSQLPPTLMVTSPSTSPTRPFHHKHAASELSPLSPTPRGIRPSPSSPQRKSATLPSLQPRPRAGGVVTSGAMPPLHSSLAAVERSSRLLKSIVRCAGCGDVGKDFPRCGRCAEAWCSRECRVKSLAGNKRHVCATSPTDTSTPNSLVAAG